MSRRPFRLWTGASLRPLESGRCKAVWADPSRPTTQIATRGRDPPPTAGQPWRRLAVCEGATTPRRHDASPPPDASFWGRGWVCRPASGRCGSCSLATVGELADVMLPGEGMPRGAQCLRFSRPKPPRPPRPKTGPLIHTSNFRQAPPRPLGARSPISVSRHDALCHQSRVHADTV